MAQSGSGFTSRTWFGLPLVSLLSLFRFAPLEPASRASWRWKGFVLSAFLHAAIAGCVPWLGGHLHGEAAYPRLTVVMLPKEKSGPDKIVWFPRAAAIPDVAPAQPFGPAKTPQGIRDPAGQTLIAHSAEPKSTRQFIWQPEHPQPLPNDVPTPNLVTLAEGAPALPKAPLKAFVPPPAPKPKSDAKPVPDILPPPDSTRGALRADSTLQQLIQQIPTSVAKPAPKLFVPPSQKSAPAAGPAQLPEAPSVPSRVGPQSGGSGGSAGSSLQAVVAGLNPAAGPLPEGSRGAEFARAPVAGTPSSGSPAKPGTPSVPGLVAHNANGKPPPEATAPAGSAKVPERFLVKETNYAAFNRTLSVPLRPSSRVIPATVEAQFANRNVYTLVIPKPDLPEYSDDWVLWFSERQSGDMMAPRISAPVPARKYSLVGGAPVANSANGTLQLAAVVERSGRISAARILRGTAGDAFRRRALEELQTWEFQPALRNGEAIEVDIVLEISFQFRAGAQQAR
jgi:TonB family protein